MPTPVIVTGGAGFIGSHVADALLAQGHAVTVVDDLSAGSEAKVPAGAKLVAVDIVDRPALQEVFDEVQPAAVYHLAAQASVT
ncbi:MAG TPA: NAD-dependent epimerase/dehydratase family protein, partial [Solirubrobacteraceae bacterium]|nr:NAD-dependent epimerase/dehydratase family protein [Solirubrobacteraceae bacterium]